MTCLRIGLAVALAAATISCSSTKRHAAEYKQQYCLAEDVHLYWSRSFTGLYSAWFGGPRRVETLCSATLPVPGARVIKKGSPVRVRRLFTLSAVDASYSEAELHITDPETGILHEVYVKWPGAQSLLARRPGAD